MEDVTTKPCGQEKSLDVQGTQGRGIGSPALSGTVAEDFLQKDNDQLEHPSEKEKPVPIRNRLKKMKKAVRKFRISEEERYQIVLDEFEACTPKELDNIEVLLTKERECGQQLERFGGIVSIFVSLLSMTYSVGNSITSSIAGDRSLVMSPDEAAKSLIGLMLVCVGVIAIYMFIRYTSQRQVNPAVYLLTAMKKYRKGDKS